MTNINLFLTFALLIGIVLPSTKGMAQTPSYAQDLIQKARTLDVAHSHAWLKLLHYDHGFFGYSSNIASEKTFFLAPKGSSNPEAELESTLLGFFSTEPHTYSALMYDPKKPESQFEKQTIRCQFPARFRFLKNALGIDESKLPALECKELDHFRKNIAAKSISVVFSSFFLDSPSSAFGHSFLRFNKSELGASDSEHQELLDYGINFAAEKTTDNPFLYALFGLTGVFRGTYSKVPYYYKVREYNDFESRDLWSYELNLTPAEIELLVDHVWELGPSWHQYWYFTLNCGNAILYAIEAAAPRYPIGDALKFYVIPSDTVKEIYKIPGFVNKVSYRPAARALFYSHAKTLNHEENQALHSMIDHDFDRTDSTLPSASKAKVIDVAMDFFDYKYAHQISDENSPVAKKRQVILSERASLGIQSETSKITPPEEGRPHVGHGSMRLGLEGGQQNNQYFSQFNLRFALHDALDPSDGYPKISQVEFGNLSLRYFNNPSKLRVEQLRLFRLFSLRPYDEYSKVNSWRFDLKGVRFYDRNCAGCFGAEATYAIGRALQWSDSWVPYVLLETNLDWAAFSGSAVRIGAGPVAGLLFKAKHWAWMSEATYRYYAFAIFPQMFIANSEFRFSPTTDWTFGVKASRTDLTNEGSLTIARFF